MRALPELLVAIAVIAIGAFFFGYTENIETFGDDPSGPKFLPRIVCTLMIIFGLVLALKAIGMARQQGEPFFRLHLSEGITQKVIPLGLVSFAYAGLFIVFGYILSTVLMIPPVLWIYGHRGWTKLTAIALITTAIYYVLFIRLMGVFDPPGLLIDLSHLFRW